MRVVPISTMFAFSSINILTHALPFAPREPQRPQAHFKRVPYSVVAVDGSSPSSVSVAVSTETKTITQASETTETVIVTLAPSILTVVATVTISGPESEKTVFVTPTATKFSTAPVSMSSSTVSLDSPSSTASELSQASGTAQLPLSTVSVLPLPISSSLTTSSSSTSFKTSNTANRTRPTPTTSCDDGSWHTSYPAWNPTSSSISIPTSTSSRVYPSLTATNEKYGAATVIPPSSTLQDHLPTGGVASWNDAGYTGTSLKSWNGTAA